MRAFDMAISVPWAIRPDALQMLLDMAQRVHEPDMAAAIQKAEERMREIDPMALATGSGTILEGSNNVRMRGSVAVLCVEGPLFRYANLFTEMSGATSLDSLATDLKVALMSDSVQSILLHVDSPGGQVNGTAEFADALYKSRAIKPTVAFISNDGCSAAYWIASAASKVVVAPTSLVGSIGAVLGISDPRRDRSGAIEFVSSQAPKKRPDPHTRSGHAELANVVDTLGQQFIDAVAQYRGVTSQKVEDDFGQGGVFVGQQAVDAGLADSVGTFDQTLAEMEGTTTVAASDSDQVDAAPAAPTPPEEEYRRSKPRRRDRGMSSHWDRLIAAIRGIQDDEGASGDSAADADLEPTTDQQLTPVVAAAQQPAVHVLRGEMSTTVPPGFNAAEFARMKEERDRAQDESRRLRAERIQERAEAFFDTLQKDGRATAAERDGIIVAHVQAATDDSVYGMPNGETLTRIEKLEKAYAARPKNMLTMEAIPQAVQQFVQLSNQRDTPAATPDNASMSDERRRHLLAHTPVGQQVLSNTNGTSRN